MRPEGYPAAQAQHVSRANETDGAGLDKVKTSGRIVPTGGTATDWARALEHGQLPVIAQEQMI